MGIWGSLDRQQGEITLNVPDSFYFLHPKNTEKVLVKVWGNPPGGAEYSWACYSMESTPFDQDAWGGTIEYQENGYVSDDEADEINYDKMLSAP